MVEVGVVWVGAEVVIAVVMLVVAMEGSIW